MVGTIWGERASRVCVRQVSRKLRHATHHVSVETRDHTVATQPHSNSQQRKCVLLFFPRPPPLERILLCGDTSPSQTGDPPASASSALELLQVCTAVS